MIVLSYTCPPTPWTRAGRRGRSEDVVRLTLAAFFENVEGADVDDLA